MGAPPRLWTHRWRGSSSSTKWRGPMGATLCFLPLSTPPLTSPRPSRHGGHGQHAWQRQQLTRTHAEPVLHAPVPSLTTHEYRQWQLLPTLSQQYKLVPLPLRPSLSLIKSSCSCVRTHSRSAHHPLSQQHRQLPASFPPLQQHQQSQHQHQHQQHQQQPTRQHSHHQQQQPSPTPPQQQQ